MGEHYTKTDLRHIAEGMAEELRECEDGTVTSTHRLAHEFEYTELDDEKLFDLHNALFRAARAQKITLDMSEHKDKVEGMLFNLTFIVRNRRAQIKCPHCGSNNTARILYGMPVMSDELENKLDTGKVVLGGCCIGGVEINGEFVSVDQTRHCNDCHKDFGKPPVLIKGDIAEDFRDIVESIEFSDGGYLQGHTTVKIKRNDNGAVVEVNQLPYGHSYQESRQITDLRFQRLVNKLYSELYLHEWKKRYNNRNVLDGEQWSLEIRLTGGRKRTWSGSNDFPPYWKELKSLFKPFITA